MYLVCGKYPENNEKLKVFSERYAVARHLFLESALVSQYKIVEAKPADFADYRYVHSKAYVDILEKAFATGKTIQGVPSEVVGFERVGVGGTLTAVRLALEENCFAYHLGGGYHHGLPDKPNGIDYCNDVAIALSKILSFGVKKVLYIDLDAHYPDGIQKIFGAEPRIMQISLHGWPERSKEGHYSFIGEGAALGKKINMPLPLYTGDRIYLKILKTLLVSVLQNYQPEAVFYQAGVDSYFQDPVGCLNLSLRGLYERDKLVASLCVRQSLPFAAVLGGGYDPVNAPRAVLNTLAAFADKDILFDEPNSLGDQAAVKAFRWYNSLCTCIQPYLSLQPILDESDKEKQNA